MRRRLKLLVTSIPCLLVIFALAPTLEGPLVARPSVPVQPLRTWWGEASWYGPTFQGRLTASGELYDMSADTAAHPTLPFGSLVRVINTRRGKSVIVRINDRGPFVAGRDIDLSYEAAEKIGIIGRGVARLRLELLQVPKNETPVREVALRQ
ncbi:MAG: septal ring lytic transglycosylase RlpA family protein [Bryobacteraceae bacterium]